MAELMEALKEAEVGVAELACAQRTLKLIGGSLDNSTDGEQAATCLDTLHIVTCFLDSVLASLDSAVGAAHVAVRAMQ